MCHNVVGFPCSTQAARDLWWSKLNEVTDCERGREPRATNIQLLYYDCTTGIEYVSTAHLYAAILWLNETFIGKRFGSQPERCIMDSSLRSCVTKKKELRK